MSKAIEGAAMLAGAIGIGVVEYAMASTGVGFAALPALMHIQEALVLGGIGMEAGAIANALTSNRGMNITNRQPASPRQIIYGQQRVGGTIIWESTTGNTKNQYNVVIVIAGHPCWAVENTYLDGRRIIWQAANPAHPSAGYLVQNGFGFGGDSAGGTYVGPDGVDYSFDGKVYGQFAWGAQNGEDSYFFGGLRANDPAWDTTSAGTPYCGGCTYCYLKFEYSASTFPQFPEIRFTIDGKPVYDPRTGTTTFSSNAALIAADWLSDPVDGLGIPVNQEQLIAAANICDESVPLAGGGTEARYALHYHFDTSTAPSDALATMLKACAGRVSIIGGEAYIFPGVWVGPSASFDEGALTAPLQWDSTAAFAENCNAVTGTYTCPNYPYNTAGNLYDSNGWDSDGNIQNNFQYGFQPTSFPQYAQDSLHGYASNGWLNEDAGVSAAWNSTTAFTVGEIVSYTQTVAGAAVDSVWKCLVANTNSAPGVVPGKWQNITGAYVLNLEVNYNMVLSIAQAQRLAKIEMMRRRFWGRGTVEMNLAAFTMQECDVMNFSFAPHGWADKALEIQDTTFKVITQEASPGELPKAPECRISFNVAETDISIYEWSATEELSIYDAPILTQQSNVPAPPTAVTVTSSAATALTALDGTVTPRIKVAWDTPEDGLVTLIDLQYQLAGASAWTDAGTVSAALNDAFIGPVIAGQTYDVRICSVRPNGATSAFVEVDGVVAGLTLTILTPDGFGIGSLIASAFSDGTAAIECNPFTALVGQVSLAMFPSGEVTITGLAQQTLYYVYWIDPDFLGGNVTPIATTNKSDFLGRNGYLLIDSIVTPYYASGGGGGSGRSVPSTFHDAGSRSTTSPASAYDGDLSTYASVSGLTTSRYGPPGGDAIDATANGDGIWSGFPAVTTSGAKTLSVVLSVTLTDSFGVGATLGNVVVSASIGGTTTTLATISSTTSTETLTCSVPSGTNLASVSVEVAANPGTVPDATGTQSLRSLSGASVYEIYIS